MRKLADSDVRSALRGRSVMMRIDGDTPLSEDLQVANASRLRAAMPAIKLCLDSGVERLIIMGHLGRPEGRPNPRLSFAPVAKRLAELLRTDVFLAPGCTGPAVADLIQHTYAPNIVMLDNLRFDPGEEENNPAFIQALKSLAPEAAFVYEAFASGAKEHASTYGLIKEYPLRLAGPNLCLELDQVDFLLGDPPRPLGLLLGGKKIKEKIRVLSTYGTKADLVAVGGLMAVPLLVARGERSLARFCKPEEVEIACRGLRALAAAGTKLLLPRDFIAAEQLVEGARTRKIKVGKEVPQGYCLPDIGPGTVEDFAGALTDFGTVVANLVVGAFETPGFEQGTFAMVDHLASSRSTITVVGGGDSILALERRDAIRKISHVSMGGHALLTALEGAPLPCVRALEEAA